MRQQDVRRTIEGIHGQMLPGVQFLQHHRNLILGQREEHTDRVNLGDHQHPVGVGGMDDVSGVHQAQTYASRDRRGDMAVHHVDLRSIDHPLVRLHDPFVLLDESLLRGQLLFGNGILRHQRFVAR